MPILAHFILIRLGSTDIAYGCQTMIRSQEASDGIQTLIRWTHNEG
jgi:hypothetical protein